MTSPDDTGVRVPATEDPVSQQSIRDLALDNTDVAGVITIAAQPTVPLSPTSAPATAPAQPRRRVELRDPIKIALSYRQETNQRVQAINDLVHAAMSTPDYPDPVFYAPRFQAAVAQIDGNKVLRHIYEGAELVVVFLSPTYHQSPYCYHEWRTIKSRFMTGDEAQQYKKVLLVKLGDFDATQLGLFPDDFYIDATNISDQEVAAIIMDRWDILEKLANQ